MKTRVVVFSAWPQLLIGSNKKFDVLFEQSVDQVLTNTFGSRDVLDGLERYAVRVHDRGLYSDYEYCLLINQPVGIDLYELLEQVDADHSTYIGPERQFVLYRRSEKWQAKNITVNAVQKPWGQSLYTPPPEQCPDRVGIIFIDCWQVINDASEWKHVPYNFDFYQQMIDCLTKYQADNMVFHTGEFGSHRLADKLLPWHQQGNAVNIMDLNQWREHYQCRNLFNWIVVGAHWQRCTHEKPLGFFNLLDTKKFDPRLRIFSHMDCTAKFENNDLDKPVITTCTELDYQLDTLAWRMNGRLPELIGHAPN